MLIDLHLINFFFPGVIELNMHLNSILNRNNSIEAYLPFFPRQEMNVYIELCT